jgi:hypothetical protein
MFTDQFPDDIKTNQELDQIKASYPNYDDYYIASGSIKVRREKFNEMYKGYAPFSDINFLTDLKKHFHERTWEMYIGYTLIYHKVSFISKSKGPDILIENPGGKIWIEAIACNCGQGEDRVPVMIYDGVGTVPHDEMLIRLASGLDTKLKKYQKYMEKGIVSPSDKLIIAISAGGFSHIVDGDMPLILKVLFAIGHRTLSRPIDSEVPLTPGVSTRYFVTKKNGSQVEMDFFLKEEHNLISAVMYCSNNILNHGDPVGSDILVIRNPLAKNPLHEKMFPFMDQINTEGGFIEI